jgi:hypothetical protein
MNPNFQRLSLLIVIGVLAVSIAASCKHEKSGNQQRASPNMASPTAEATPFVITPATQWKTVEEFDHPLRGGNQPLHFKLEIPQGYNDPGDFIRIRIQSRGVPEFVLDNEDGWMEFNRLNGDGKPDPLYNELASRNLLKSNYVLMLPSSAGGGLPIVILRSWGYASNAERIHVIGFRRSGQPVTLINTELDLIEVADLDGDGQVEIAGWPCMSESVGETGSSYCPVNVYKLARRAMAPASLSEQLSKRYTEQKLGVWAGVAQNAELVVAPPSSAQGKPRVMKLDEFYKSKK